MDHYREDVCSKANELLKLKIPEKLNEIDLLLQAARFKVHIKYVVKIDFPV